MDVEVHKKIMSMVANNFKINRITHETLVAITAEPDLQHERAISEIKSDASLTVRDIAARYDSIEPDGFWDGVSLWFEKWGQIGLEKGGSALLHGAVYYRWMMAHGPEAPDNFLKHFKNAYQNPSSVVDIAFSIHYLVDTGTPFHRKELTDIQLPEDLETDVNKIKAFNEGFGFLQSIFTWHQHFEKHIKDGWNNPQYSELYTNAVIRGIEESSVNFRSVGNPYDYFENRIQELSLFAKDRCITLEDVYQSQDASMFHRHDEIYQISSECIYQISKLTADVLTCFYSKKGC